MLQRIALSLGCAVILLSSTYVIAQEDNYVFREPVHMSTAESVDNNPGNGGDGGQDPGVDVTPPNNINFNNSGTTTTGNADAGNIVYVYDENGNNIGNGFVDEEGNFSITLNPPVTGGDQLTYVAENGDGVRSEQVIVTVPSDVNVVITDPNNISFSPDGDNTTGSSDPNITVVVRDSEGNEIGRGTTNGNGDFSISLEPNVATGDELTYHAEDNNGNRSDDVVEVVPEGIGHAYDDCTIAPRSSATYGECSWFNQEGEFLGLVFKTGLKSGSYQTIYYVQRTPADSMTQLQVQRNCANNTLNGYNYRIPAAHELVSIGTAMRNNNLEIFTGSDGWAWSSDNNNVQGVAVNLNTGEQAYRNFNDKYDGYCVLVYERFLGIGW